MEKIYINIITVGYNEERNLPKLFRSLDYIKSKIQVRHIYIDQSSQDNSVGLSKENKCEVHLHENKGYADPDKKWAIDKLVNDDDWCLILDADEELTRNCSDEIICHITKKSKVGIIKISTFFLGITNGTFKQIRLFQKKSIIISDEIHNYIKLKEGFGSQILKEKIINNDLKNKENEIASLIEKQLRYAKKEIGKYENISNFKLYIYMFWKPLQWFFGWGIIHKLLFKGIKGIIYMTIMAYYQFMIFALIYEKRKIGKK